MDRKTLAVILLSTTILMIILPAQIIPRGRAVTGGLVCMPQPTDTKCTGATFTFNGPVTSPNTLLRVPVWVNNTNPMNGADITLKISDISILKPFDVDLSGTAIPGPTILVECVGGALKSGSTCNQTTDTPDTIHVSMVGFGSGTSPSGFTGLLFTAIFNITGTTAVGGITIGFQTGCTSSSVGGTTCVKMSDGTITPVPEAVQPGGFDNSNSATLPYASMTSAKTSLGQFFSGTAASTTDLLTIAAVNGFETTTSPTVTLFSPTITTVNPLTAFPLPTASLSTSLIDFSTPPTSKTSTLTANVAKTTGRGNDTVTVTASYTTTDPNTFTTTSLGAVVILPLTVLSGYSISVSPTTIANTATSNTALTTVSINPSYFAGAVKLGVMASTLPTGVTASFSATTITAPATSTLTLTVAGNALGGTYTVTVTSNSTMNGVTMTQNVALTLNVLGGHSVTIDSVKIDPQGPVSVGTKVTITVNVDNKGSSAETVTVNALANSITVATATGVAVPANTVLPVTLTWTTSAAGTFNVTTNVLLPAGETNTLTNSSNVGNYTVQASATPFYSDPTILALIGAIVAVAIIAGIVLLRRRRVSPVPA